MAPLPAMSSTDSASGVAATMKAEKANRDSLAKRKSAIKADLERVTVELEDVEQMKAEAEDLEDEELLSEMLAEEQRLQVSSMICSLLYHVKHSIKLKTFVA